MLKITEIRENENSLVRLRVEGTISRDGFADLTDALERSRDGAECIILLDLAGVDFMNDETARKLSALRSERIKVINCSPFIDTLLETVDKHEPRQ